MRGEGPTEPTTTRRPAGVMLAARSHQIPWLAESPKAAVHHRSPTVREPDNPDMPLRRRPVDQDTANGWPLIPTRIRTCSRTTWTRSRRDLTRLFARRVWVFVGRRCSGGWLTTLYNPLTCENMVELQGIEPWTSSMRTKRATNCATAPGRGLHREPSTTIAAGQRPCGHPAGPIVAAEKDHPIRKASPESTGTLREVSISAATAISSP